jgi:hypothetical protein
LADFHDRKHCANSIFVTLPPKPITGVHQAAKAIAAVGPALVVFWTAELVDKPAHTNSSCGVSDEVVKRPLQGSTSGMEIDSDWTINCNGGRVFGRRVIAIVCRIRL